MLTEIKLHRNWRTSKRNNVITVPERGIWSCIIRPTFLDLIFTVAKTCRPSTHSMLPFRLLFRHFFRSAVTRPQRSEVIGQWVRHKKNLTERSIIEVFRVLLEKNDPRGTFDVVTRNVTTVNEFIK